MDEEIVVRSPGKINLHLDIKARRADGFHEILSLFHMVDLADQIRMCSLKENDVCRIEGDFDCPVQENLIWKAWDQFRRRTGIRQGWTVRVEKRIPAGAGLGGGSGNAASVLDGLNRLYGSPLDRETLLEAAGELGSDVPFFLGGAAALVRGRGEILEELPAREEFRGVLIVPELKISTPEAYRLFDREGRVVDGLPGERLRQVYLEKKPAEWPFFNSFRDPLYRKYPVLAETEAALSRSGAVFTSLSGSGSAVYGLFAGENEAEEAEKTLKRTFSRVWKIKLLANQVGSY